MHGLDVKKTTMIMKRGLYEWIVMPFGLKNATIIFQRTINKVVEDDLNKMVKVFVDDVNIDSKDWESHSLHIDRILEKLVVAKLHLNLDKCYFASVELLLLEHLITRGGCTFSFCKVKAIM